MEFLLSEPLNHSLGAQTNLQIPSGELEAEQDDVCSPAFPQVVQPHLGHACRSHHVPLQHVSSELCGTSSAFSVRETKTDPRAHPEPCFLLSEMPWQRAKRSPNWSWPPQNRQEGGKISSNVLFLIWAKNTSLWSILSLNSYHYL